MFKVTLFVQIFALIISQNGYQILYCFLYILLLQTFICLLMSYRFICVMCFIPKNSFMFNLSKIDAHIYRTDKKASNCCAEFKIRSNA